MKGNISDMKALKSNSEMFLCKNREAGQEEKVKTNL